MIRRNTGRFAKSFLGPKEILGVLRNSMRSQRLEGVSKGSGRPPGVLGVLADPKDSGIPSGSQAFRGSWGSRESQGSWSSWTRSYIFTMPPPEMFRGKGVLKICSKFTGKHPRQNVTLIKLQSMGVLL